MANCPNSNKRHLSMRINIDVCRAIEKEYRREGDGKSDPFVRALEDIARDVELDADDLAAIAEEIRQNNAKKKGIKNGK